MAEHTAHGQEWQKVEGWAAAVRRLELLHPHAEPEALAELGSFLAGLTEAMRAGQTIHVGPRPEDRVKRSEELCGNG